MTQADWGNFFIAQIGASAALIGLLFVAVSINLQRIVAAEFLVDRVAEAVLVFGGLLMFSIFVTVPHQSVATFGIEILLGGAVIWTMTTTLMVHSLRNRPPQATLTYTIVRLVQIQTATLSTVVAGALLLMGRDAGFFWLVPVSYCSMKTANGPDYYHLASVTDEGVVKTLGEREFFAKYTERCELVSGGNVEVMPLEIVAQTSP